MTNLEKLKAIDKAYYMLIPCVKNNVVQDYGLVLTEAPNYLAELISEAETNPAASSEPANPAKETVVMISRERYAAIEEAVLYYLRSVIERPELAYLQVGTEALAKMVRVHAEITGKTPEEVRKEVSDGVAATKQEIGYTRIIVKRVMAPPPDWIAVGGKRKYRGWLIVREAEDSYLCFRPDCIDYPERGYEDYEAASAAGAKEWIDNYGEEEG